MKVECSVIRLSVHDWWWEWMLCGKWGGAFLEILDDRTLCVWMMYNAEPAIWVVAFPRVFPVLYDSASVSQQCRRAHDLQDKVLSYNGFVHIFTQWLCS